MGLGAVIISPDDVRHEVSINTHAHGCNNEAELRALMAALASVLSMGGRCVRVMSDSSLLVERLGPSRLGVPQPPMARFQSMLDAAQALMSRFEQVELLWVPRHRNVEADALARAALGLPPKVRVIRSA